MKKGHIKPEEQKEIFILLNKGYNKSEIALAMDRCHTSIGREIKRNLTNGRYDPRRAKQKARNRRKCSKYQGMKIRGKPALEAYVKEKLKLLWTPEKIAGRLKEIDTHIPCVSAKGIYKWLYSCFGQPYCRYLPKQRYKPKRKKPGGKIKREMIRGRVGIERRPAAANDRLEYGHYEGDTVVSGKKYRGSSSLSVITERKARYVRIRKIPNLKPESNNAAVGEMGHDLVMKTCTLDNGIENKGHETLALILGIDIYFCDPYASWQKGGVENVNGIIRRFIPKGANISDYTDQEIRIIEDYLNHTPRKCLNYKTPCEVMTENNLFLKKSNSRMCD
jgi:IS30 family transposase